MTASTIFTANPHHNGYDLIPGRDITNTRVGVIYWDRSGLDGGLGLRLNNGSETVDELLRGLAEGLVRRLAELEAVQPTKAQRETAETGAMR